MRWDKPRSTISLRLDGYVLYTRKVHTQGMERHDIKLQALKAAGGDSYLWVGGFSSPTVLPVHHPPPMTSPPPR